LLATENSVLICGAGNRKLGIRRETKTANEVAQKER